MATPKDALYKQRQDEFRRINKRKVNIDEHGNLHLETIKHKLKYTGERGR